MKTPSYAGPLKLYPSPDLATADTGTSGTDLDPGKTLQKVVNFDLKEEGNHVLGVTVSYYEASDTSGRTRTFRKLYQFICKASLIVRTKAGRLPPSEPRGIRRWVLEAQLENCSEIPFQLEKLALEPEPTLVCTDCNWEATRSRWPVLHPGEVEQVCFVVTEEQAREDGPGTHDVDGRTVLGALGIGWRGEMGNRGYLSTGKLGTRRTK